MSTAKRLTDRKRDAILEAGIAAFGELGFDNASMDAISQRAAVSKRTVYNHFASKDALFEAIVKRLKENAHDAVPLAYSDDSPLSEQLEQFCLRVIAFHCRPDSRTLGRVLISRFIRAPELGREMFGKVKIFEGSLCDWIVAAQKAGRLKKFDVRMGARQLLALLESFCIWPQLLVGEPNPTPKRRKEITTSAIQMFLSSYRM